MPLDNVYGLWFVPTDKGRDEFGWEEHRIIGGESLESVQEEAYFLAAEEPPDYKDYCRYVIRKETA